LLPNGLDATGANVSDEKRISIVIPTYNRRERLGRVLAALGAQTTPARAFDVLVVDDGSTDGTAQGLQGQAYPFALRVIRQANGGPAKARNAGVQAAEAPLVLFLDDDVVPAPGLVAEHLRLHDAEPDVVVLGPMSSLDHYPQPWVAWEQAKLESQYAAMARGDWAPTFRQFWTGNASVAGRHVLAAGGFDPAFLRAEDIELGFRLQRLGLGFRFNPEARGLHYAERSLTSWAKIRNSYGTLDVAILEKMGEDALINILGDTWAKLHGLVQGVILACSGHRLRAKATESALLGWLQVEAAMPRAIAAEQVCSVLANLIYWQASIQRLGPARWQAVRERGAALRAGAA
jgi:GT2 family glycosyltransferase